MTTLFKLSVMARVMMCGILLSVLPLPFAQADLSSERAKIAAWPAYYQVLAGRCPKAGSDRECCLESVEEMVKGRYRLARYNGGCPEGYEGRGFKCSGSYMWCVPKGESGGLLGPFIYEADDFVDEIPYYKNSSDENNNPVPEENQ